jgi:hypothetical protein
VRLATLALLCLAACSAPKAPGTDYEAICTDGNTASSNEFLTICEGHGEVKRWVRTVDD